MGPYGVPPLRHAALASALLLALATPASADATAFIGLSTEPETRRTVGFAIGAGLLVVGFEVEYAHTSEDPEAIAPSLRTFMGNLLLQTPVALSGLQFYGTVGGGAVHESFEGAEGHTHVGTNVGGGVKIRLAGPLRLRLDYRVLLFTGEWTTGKPQRFSAGLNLAF
jgi:hypothetical protein